MRKISLGIKIGISIFSFIFFLGLLELSLKIAGHIYIKGTILNTREYADTGSVYNILCIGDSYTVGGAVKPKLSYPKQLQKLLSQNYSMNINVINGGICESNSSQALERLSKLVKGYKPNCAILLIGSANRFNLLGYQEYKGNKKDFIAKLQIYKMFKILAVSLKEKILKWKLNRYVEQNKERFNSKSRLNSKSKNIENTQKGKKGDKIEGENYTEILDIEYANDIDGIVNEEEHNLNYERLGEQYYIRGDYKKAEGMFKKTIELDPKDIGNYERLGYYYIEGGDYKKAEGMFKKIIELDPALVMGYVGLGNAYRCQNKYKKAEEWFKKAIEANPNDVTGYHELGYLYDEQGFLEEAQNNFKKAIEVAPHSIGSYSGLGYTYLRQGEYNKAVEVFKKEIELNPNNTEGYIGLGRCYFENGNFKKASGLFKKAIEVDSYDIRGFEELANVYVEEGYYREAEELFEKILRIGHSDVVVYIGLGRCYVEQGKYKKAEEILKKAIELNPQNLDLYIDLGNFYVNTKQLDKAENFFKKVLDKNPQLDSVYVDLGICYARQLEYQRAEKAFKKAIELNPGYNKNWAYTELANIYIEQGNLVQGIDVLIKAIEYTPQRFANYYFLLKAYELQSKYNSEDIISRFHEIINRNPSYRKIKLLSNYIQFFKDKRKWEKKIDRWLRHDLKKIVELCKNNNVELIIQNYPYPYHQANEALEDIAREYALPLVDNFSVFEKLVNEYGNGKYFEDDDHCTARGHRVMVGNIYKVLTLEGIITERENDYNDYFE